MTKQKSTKRALLLSALSLLMCVSMLIGSTFAWFTDSVTSAGNKIISGSLKVDLIHAHYEGNTGSAVKTSLKENPDHKVFDYSLWEPGYTQVEYFQIINKGNLHFQYQMELTSEGVLTKLADVIEVYGGYPSTAYGLEREAALENMTYMGTVSEIMAKGGKLFQGNTGGMELKEDAPMLAYAIALHMKEEAGNDYQDLPLFEGETGFNITLMATQVENEFDSFGNDYDRYADYDGEISNAVSLAAALKNGGTYKVISNIALDAYVTVPAGVTVALDLNGKTISAASGNVIRNNGNLTVANGTLQGTTTYTINNESATGSVTVENVKSVNGGFFNAGSMVVNNCEITNTASGKHALCNGSSATSLVVNGGTYSTTATNALIYAYGGTIEVNDGNFTQIGSSFMLDGSGITINGGTFTDDEGKWAIRGTHTIAGGTFNFDPSAYVADGYAAIKNDNGSYTVYGSGDTMTVADGAVLDLGGVAFPGKIVAEGDLTIKGDTSIKTLSSTSGGTITVEEGKTLTLNNFSFGSSSNADAEYVITGGTVTANYGFFQHGTYALHSDFETGYMYYSYGSDITVYGTFHSQGKGDGLDYVRGKVTIADGGKSIHDGALWVGQPANWGAMSATLIVEDGGSVEANSLSVYPGSTLQIDAETLSAGDVTNIVCNTLNVTGTVETIKNDALTATVDGNKIVLE